MNAAAWNESFGIPGLLWFDEESGLCRANITTPAANATVYLHGAHLTHWQPAGQEPVLFLSARSEFAEDRPIRGGVPIIFPWFGPRKDGGAGPAHGFARLQDWELVFAGLAGEEVHLAFSLGPSEMSRRAGFDRFRLVFELTIGAKLGMKLSVANEGTEAMVFEEALHTYLAVADARRVEIAGLEDAPFLDKTDGMARKAAAGEALRLSGTTDRIYGKTGAEVRVRDEVAGRTVRVAKSNSETTVVWNPWMEVAATLADMEPEGWEGMVCVETANVGESAVRLAAGATHTMAAVIEVERSVAGAGGC